MVGIPIRRHIDMKTILIVSALSILAGCTHSVRLTVKMPIAAQDQGCSESLQRASATNQRYPKELKSRKLTSYRVVYSKSTGVSCLAGLIAVGTANGHYRQLLEAKGTK